jgi:hypothetical protein
VRPLHKLKILFRKGRAGLQPDSRCPDQPLPDSQSMPLARVQEEG